MSVQGSAGQATNAGTQGGVLIAMLDVTLARSLAFLSRDTVADQAVFQSSWAGSHQRSCRVRHRALQTRSSNEASSGFWF